ncbi:MAG: 3-hydroxyacyl-CoA dehydrogenase NAD-binding domain-containing protein [Candidatus Acidiferrales bacterium]
MTNPSEPGTVAILGADTLGARFAVAALRAGYRTILEDFRFDVLERASLGVREALATMDARERLGVARTVEDACRQADFVIDTTVDDAELKLEIFTLLDKFALPGAVCATVAASIAIAELGAITYRPELCVGLRLQSVGPDAELLTVVRATQTSEETVRACLDFARRVQWQSAIESEAVPPAALLS